MTPLKQSLQLTDGDRQVVFDLRDDGDLERQARNVALAVAQGILVSQDVISQILHGGRGPLPALKPHQRRS